MAYDNLNRRDFLKGTGFAFASSLVLGRLARSAEIKPSASDTNLLFIITDQQRWDALSLAGNKILHTPNLDRLAKEGCYFENAYTVCPVCAPARTSILTGQNISATDVGKNPDAHKEHTKHIKTYDAILAKNGYHTEFYGKWHSPLYQADCYDNRITACGLVESRFGPGMSKYYMQYLRDNLSPREPREGEQGIFPGFPYKPDPIDPRYGLKPCNEIIENERKRKIFQPDCHGCLDIPVEYTWTAMQAKETIDALSKVKEPFSLTCSFQFPHTPMILPKPYHGMCPIDDIVPPASIGDAMENSPYKTVWRAMPREYRDKDKIRYMISNYYGLIREIDDWVGRIISKIDALGLKDNTLVVFTSDHGEMLGSHGMREKNVFYEESVHIPLLMRFPKAIPAGTVVKEPVSQIDLFATILDYLGLQASFSHGQSLRSRIENQKGSGFVVSEWDYDSTPNFMVISEEWKFLFSRTPESPVLNALYNLQEDPYEMNNLIGKSDRRGDWLNKGEEMKDILVSWLEKVNSPHLDSVKRRKV